MTFQDAFAKGEIYIGSLGDGFQVHEGITTGHKCEGYCFTLVTPKRKFNLSADTENERDMWMKALQDVISEPMTEHEKEGNMMMMTVVVVMMMMMVMVVVMMMVMVVVMMMVVEVMMMVMMMMVMMIMVVVKYLYILYYVPLSYCDYSY